MIMLEGASLRFETRADGVNVRKLNPVLGFVVNDVYTTAHRIHIRRANGASVHLCAPSAQVLSAWVSVLVKHARVDPMPGVVIEPVRLCAPSLRPATNARARARAHTRTHTHTHAHTHTHMHTRTLAHTHTRTHAGRRGVLLLRDLAPAAAPGAVDADMVWHSRDGRAAAPHAS